jgi:hypothetical protein
MKSFAEIEARLEAAAPAQELLAMAEEVLAQWVAARGEEPTAQSSEGFRLLALHRQGARGAPSFNACRETCREIAYHFNLLQAQPAPHVAGMMALLVKHLLLFVRGKLEVEGLGEFCCSSRSLRLESAAHSQEEKTPHG